MAHTRSVGTLAVVLALSTVLMGAYMARAETAASYTEGYFLYNGPAEFWEKIADGIEATDIPVDPDELKEVAAANGLSDDIIRTYRYFIYSYALHGLSLYTIGCFLPHEPPLNIGESVQCGVLFMSLGSPVTITDLHVYAVHPSGTTSIKEWNWAPDTIPDPFLWLSDPITLTEAGEWKVVADFTNGGKVVLTLDVTFNVVPESILGVAGVIAAPFALLAYRLRRRAAVQQ